ncbi:histamine H3 receptor-like [Pseudophryne corroboree]|uniref:histamine H3 receptor-like n=1 Tax=Pseudophryne corroboree TaxID=495146 RepID=UPI0030817BC4
MQIYSTNASLTYAGDNMFSDTVSISNLSHVADGMGIIQAVLMSCMISVTGTGNALVILGFITNKKLRTPSNYFILNLAISDFFTGTFSLPLYLKNFIISRRWVLGKSICKLWLTIDYTLCQCTIYNIVLISCDRFIAVTKAVKYRDQQNKMKMAFIKMSAVWIIAFLNFGPAIIFWEYVVGYSVVPEGECNPEFYYGGRYLLYSSFFDFFTPMAVIAYFNLSIYFNIRCRMKSKVLNTGNKSTDLLANINKDIFVVSCTNYNSNCLSTSTQLDQEVQAHKNKTHFLENFLWLCKTTHHSTTKTTVRNESSRIIGPLDLAKNSALSKDKKIAKSLALLVCTFCICWAPYSFLTIITEGFWDKFMVESCKHCTRI